MRGQKGQTALELAVLFAAMAAASSLMATYVRHAMRANVKATEMQLNGAMKDNRPIGTQ